MKMGFFVNTALSCAVPVICCLLWPGGSYQTCWWSLISERSLEDSSPQRITGNSFSFPRDCVRTQRPCSARWWAVTSAHDCHARTHAFWSVEHHQGITWRAHHGYHQEEESKLCYRQVVWNFVRGGIRLMTVLQTKKDFIPCSPLASAARHAESAYEKRTVPEHAAWEKIKSAQNVHDSYFNIQNQMFQSLEL